MTSWSSTDGHAQCVRENTTLRSRPEEGGKALGPRLPMLLSFLLHLSGGSAEYPERLQDSGFLEIHA